MKPSFTWFVFAVGSLWSGCASPAASGGSKNEPQEGDGGRGGTDNQGGSEEPPNVAGRSGGEAGSGVGGKGGGGGGNVGAGGTSRGGAGGSPMAGGGMAGSSAGAGGTAVVGNAALYAWDDFSAELGEINGDGPRGFFDIGKASGKGWDRGWDQGEHTGEGYFAFADMKPLTFGALATSGNYLLRRRWDLGRTIDLTQPKLAPFVQQEQVAKAGTVVWMSVLVRLEASTVKQNNDLAMVTLHHHSFGYHYYNGDTAWVAGVWPSRGVNNWRLWVASGTDDPSPSGTDQEVRQSARMTTKAAVVGAANLVVVKVEISGGSSDRISLYVDPPALGGAPPAEPDAVAMTGQSARFRTFAVGGNTGDDNPYPTSFDEVRIGSSFAAVTPTR